MTLPAAYQVEGVAGPAYTVAARCAVPGCSKVTEHAHHIVARSKGAAWDWVQLADGTVVANKTGLCADHHAEVHGGGKGGGHAAWIQWADGYCVWGHAIGNNPALPVFDPVGLLDPSLRLLSVSTCRSPPRDRVGRGVPTCGAHKRRQLSRELGPGSRPAEESRGS
jgi:hypothetical protein